jgi:lysozyme family protein
MADFKKYFPTLIKWEGTSFEVVPGDAGGPTKYGVILAEWKAKGWDKDGDKDVDVDDLKLITASDAADIAKTHYWDKLKADRIANQSIAEFIVDFAYNCGVGTAAKKVQEILGVTKDGVVGPITLKAINEADQQQFFDTLKQKREDYYRAIVANKPSQAKFLRGWLRRNNSFSFSA